MGGNDGAPAAPLIADERGALYGTTNGGGASGGAGVVFKLTPPKDGNTAWAEQTLWSFSFGSDGGGPAAGLIADRSGALYGTTVVGGAFNNGVVFKLTPPEDGKTAWTEQTLWTFTGGNDGRAPGAGLIADRAGALYGTTAGGGGSNPGFFCGYTGNGVVFKLTLPAYGSAAWTETTLWTFSGGSVGSCPSAPLIADDRGALYGTTVAVGAINAPSCVNLTGGSFGCGVVFRLTGTGFAPGRPD